MVTKAHDIGEVMTDDGTANMKTPNRWKRLLRRRQSAPWWHAIALVIAAATWVLAVKAHAQQTPDRAKPAEVAKYREAAWAHFRKRCSETAGDTILRTVENVDGVLLLRPRRQATEAQLADQFWLGDPYGHDSMLPDSEIRNFLRDLNERDVPVIRQTTRPGYRYVETKDELYGYRRFELDETHSQIVERQIEKPISRYGITWQDISTQEDRKYWVAGGKLQVIDLETNDVLGFRVGYLIEPGFGSQGGGRRPWLHARLTSSERAACPPFRAQSLVPINRLFVEKILKPKRGG